MKLLYAAGLTLGVLSATSWSQDTCCSTGETAACCATDEGEQSAALTLSFPLRGLRDQNEQAFAKALRSVGRDLYECAGHSEATRDEPGTCDACGGATLARRHVPAFRSMGLEVEG